MAHCVFTPGEPSLSHLKSERIMHTHEWVGVLVMLNNDSMPPVHECMLNKCVAEPADVRRPRMQCVEPRGLQFPPGKMLLDLVFHGIFQPC